MNADHVERIVIAELVFQPNGICASHAGRRADQNSADRAH
jgi:hypothetical protein